jgi:hypothetical protein
VWWPPEEGNDGFGALHRAVRTAKTVLIGFDRGRQIQVVRRLGASAVRVIAAQPRTHQPMP